jgi:hypothetical protein
MPCPVNLIDFLLAALFKLHSTELEAPAVGIFVVDD